MRQQLDRDEVSRVVAAPPEQLYAIVADVPRTPGLSSEVVRCSWLDGATGPAVGARFTAVNKAGRMRWSNRPVVIAAEPGREFAFARTELLGGTMIWRYLFDPVDGGTRVTESYQVIRPVPLLGWFLISIVSGLPDRRADLRRGMTETLDRLAVLAEGGRREPAAPLAAGQ